jgi:hypothetical protein
MREVDIARERDDGMIVGIEVKASATVKAGDFAGLRALAEACGDPFAFGTVLYDNTDVVPFGDRLAAEHCRVCGIERMRRDQGLTELRVVGGIRGIV